MSTLGIASTLAPELRKLHPCATLDSIAEMISAQTGTEKLSRERIRQILNREGVPTGHFVQEYICNKCGEKYRPLKGGSKEKSGPNSWSKQFCSPECRKLYNRATLVCDQCGKVYATRKYSELRNNIKKAGQRYTFCSKSCFGVWMGKHHVPYRGPTVILTCAICSKQFERNAAVQRRIEKLSIERYCKKPMSLCSLDCKKIFMSQVRKKAA